MSNYNVFLEGAWFVKDVATGEDAIGIAISESGKRLNPKLEYVGVDVGTMTCAHCEEKFMSVYVVADTALVGLLFQMKVYEAESEEHAARIATSVIGKALRDVPLKVSAVEEFISDNRPPRLKQSGEIRGKEHTDKEERPERGERAGRGNRSEGSESYSRGGRSGGSESYSRGGRSGGSESYGRGGRSGGSESYGRGGRSGGSESHGRGGRSGGSESYGRGSRSGGSESYGRGGRSGGSGSFGSGNRSEKSESFDRGEPSENGEHREKRGDVAGKKNYEYD